jgi:N-acylneuraminate cytidylyltransferase
MRIAIIPARGGSKRIPLKNIRLFAGLPILAWSIRAAIESRCFDKIIVSTDSIEIQRIANVYGAETPFLRPENLSGDHVGTIPVVAHATDWLIKNGNEVSEVCCIYATAPFVKGDDLRRSLKLLCSSDVDYVFSVTDFPYPIQRAIRLNSKERVQMFYPEFFHTRSQDLEKAWHDAGQFYWGKSKTWLDQTPIFGEKSTVLKLPHYRVQDIDTLDDWHRAELLFQILQGNINK